MTKREAAIVSAYTGTLLSSFDEMHKYIEEKLNRPIFTHELGEEEIFMEIHEKTKEDFCSIVVK